MHAGWVEFVGQNWGRLETYCKTVSTDLYREEGWWHLMCLHLGRLPWFASTYCFIWHAGRPLEFPRVANGANQRNSNAGRISSTNLHHPLGWKRNHFCFNWIIWITCLTCLSKSHGLLMSFGRSWWAAWGSRSWWTTFLAVGIGPTTCHQRLGLEFERFPKISEVCRHWKIHSLRSVSVSLLLAGQQIMGFKVFEWRLKLR